MTLVSNGFNAVADPPPISVAEENIAPYSFPGEAFNFSPEDAALFSRFKNNDKERKIHCNIELTAEELQNLKNVQNEAAKLGRNYYVSITVMATRYISYARGDTAKAIKLMDETQAWRTQYFGNGPIKDSDVRNDLSHGILYFSGRDYQLRPILVVRAVRVPKEWDKDGTGVQRLIKMLVFCMEYLRRYMFLPGIVENIVVVIDLAGLSASQVPVSALKSIYSVLSHHYIVRVFKFYIVNLSFVLRMVSSTVQAFLSDRQRQKLNFLDNSKDCVEMCAAHQLEQDLGGSRPKIEQFFPFPLLPGPFEKGCKSGENRDAVQNCHKALTPEGMRGRLWDVTKSAEDNCKFEYTEDAEAIFNALKLPIPPNCPRKATEEAKTEEAPPVDPPPEQAPVVEEKKEEGEKSDGLKASVTEESQPTQEKKTSTKSSDMDPTQTSDKEGLNSMWVNNASEKPAGEANQADVNLEPKEAPNPTPAQQKPCAPCCSIM
jgi:hypothetical protein|mmetsp:Transcript_102660/g.162237  ORF Transcript_102660/g.162237 Transcript_102660/m.162237 type:complete len:488 (-) Transcript_102660:213-1676(-)